MSKYGKNKLSELDYKEIMQLKGTKSSYQVGKQYNISHTMVCKIWNKSNVNQSKPIDSEILKKMIPLFVEKGLQVNLTNEEIERVQNLALEVL